MDFCIIKIYKLDKFNANSTQIFRKNELIYIFNYLSPFEQQNPVDLINRKQY